MRLNSAHTLFFIGTEAELEPEPSSLTPGSGRPAGNRGGQAAHPSFYDHCAMKIRCQGFSVTCLPVRTSKQACTGHPDIFKKFPNSSERSVFHTALAAQLESFLRVCQKLFVDLKTVWGLQLLLLFASSYHLIFQNLINTLQRSKIIGHTLAGSQICFTCACNSE